MKNLTWKFNEETHDGKKVKISFLNGLLRVEIPLREDITTDVEIQ
jgi:HSP20 family molecular chaperone IbpA